MARISPYGSQAAATPVSFRKGGAGPAGPFESNNNSRHLHTRIAGSTEGSSFAVGCAVVPLFPDVPKLRANARKQERSGNNFCRIQKVVGPLGFEPGANGL